MKQARSLEKLYGHSSLVLCPLCLLVIQLKKSRNKFYLNLDGLEDKDLLSLIPMNHPVNPSLVGISGPELCPDSFFSILKNNCKYYSQSDFAEM